MIEDLTKEKLIEYGFNSDIIERLLTWDNYETGHFKNDFYCFWASNIEGKIYSEVDAKRKYFFRNGVIAFPFSDIALHSEYYQKSLSKYLDDKKKRLGNGFDEIEAIKKFIEYQKRITGNSIEELKKSKFKRDELFFKIEVYEEFLIFLNKQLPTSQPPAKTLDSNDAEPPQTFTSILTFEQLKRLHKQLNNKYIKPIAENDFIFYFSNKPLVNNMAKIYWLKGKGVALYLVEKITVNFSMPTMNKCFETDFKKFDSNDRSKTDYKEIDLIIDDCK